MEPANLQEMNPDHDLYSEKEMSDDFYERLKILEEFDRVAEDLNEDDDEEDEEEEEFSFVWGGGHEDAAVAAEDAFSDGKIKAVFPLFDQSLLYSGADESQENLPMRPPVEKVFVETNDGIVKPVTSSSQGNDEIVGPYCDWSSRKAAAAAAAPEACKKSNSTGFSKIWRLKEQTARCNSDGRDAFVFLNGNHAPPPKTVPPTAPAKTMKKSGKSKAAASAHEVYLRSKAKEEERRRSYLPYRPELMGFFTNVNGGLTRNVHPF